MRKIILGFLVLILTIILAVFLGEWIFEKTYQFPKLEYGVTFSPGYAQYLKLDWQKTYLNILDELKVRNFRLPGYWDSLEPEPQKYDFSDTDFMLEQAAKRGAKVILVLGARQPRWPECHIPSWAKNLDLEQRQEKTLEFIQKVIERYKNNSAIWAYQVENEPLLAGFGEGCDPIDITFLKSEVELVKKLDNRPVVLTDSGELGSWIDAMELSNIFGTSVYRASYNFVLGYFSYPTLPVFYNLKLNLVRLFASNNKKTIISELQAEPWIATVDLQNNADKQAKAFPLNSLISNVNFAQRTGFDEIYLWGVEWWYFMAQHGYPQYLNYAKTLFR